MEKRIEQTYSKFLKALTKLLKEKNYEDISISEICEKADIKRPTFYNHFNDKEDFIVKMVRYLYKQRPASLNDIKDFKTFCKEFTFYCLKYLEKIRNPIKIGEGKIETSELYFVLFKEMHIFLKKRYQSRAYPEVDPADEDFFLYRMSSRIIAFLIFFYNSDTTMEEMKKHVDITMDFHYIWYFFNFFL